MAPPSTRRDAAATVGSRAPPRFRAVVALGGVGGRRSEAIHTDAVLNEVHGRGAREVQEAALGRGVSDVPRLSLMPRRGDDHDDAAATRVGDHAPRHVLGAEEGAGEVYRDLAGPAVERHLEI